MRGRACSLAGDGLAARAVWEELRARRPEDPRVEAYLALLSASDVAPVSAGANADGLEAPDDSPPPARKKKKKGDGSPPLGWGLRWHELVLRRTMRSSPSRGRPPRR